MKQMFDLVPKAIALLSFAILALTVIHEWGYFFVIGSHFQTVASAYDYLSNSILWLPQNALIVLLAAGLASVMQLALTSLIRPLVDEQEQWGHKISAQRNKTIERFTIGFAGGCFVLSIVSAALFYFFERPYNVFGYSGAGILLWFSIYFLVRIKSQTKIKIPQSAWAVILAIPPFLIIDFSIGAQEAYNDVRGFRDVYALALKGDHVGNEGSNKLHVQVLRSFDKGVLVRDPKAEKIYFFRWDVIKSLSHFDLSQGSDTRGCRRFPRICGVTPWEP